MSKRNRKQDKARKQQKSRAREAKKRDASIAKSANAPKRPPKQPRENSRPSHPANPFGFTIIDAGSGKVMEFDDRGQGLSVARALSIGADAADCFEMNDALNDAMPTVPDDNGIITSQGHRLIAYGDDRTPAHLFPASQVFAVMPCGSDDYLKLEVIRDTWVGVRALDPSVTPMGFLLSLGSYDPRLAGLWEQYAVSEQAYMDAWAVNAALDSRVRLACQPPQTAEAVTAVLRRAVATYERTLFADCRHDELGGCLELYLACDAPTERLLSDACAAMGDGYPRYFPKDESQRMATLHLGDGVGLGCASAYIAAAEYLQSQGIACAPWACWD